jgi:hypothetical protein
LLPGTFAFGWKIKKYDVSSVTNDYKIEICCLQEVDLETDFLQILIIFHLKTTQLKLKLITTKQEQLYTSRMEYQDVEGIIWKEITAM